MKHKGFRFWWPFAGLAAAALFSLVIMALWNWLLPDIAGLPEITFLQAVGLLVLSRILFGGIGGPGKMAMGGTLHECRGRINPFREKWEKMNNEEQREFIRKFHSGSPWESPAGPAGQDSPDKDKE
jgi:hypothetical protein